MTEVAASSFSPFYGEKVADKPDEGRNLLGVRSEFPLHEHAFITKTRRCVYKTGIVARSELVNKEFKKKRTNARKRS
ncbi:hypothetical protein ASE37_07930 [Rhizobium sp. Root268]|nr:hypothetical protein ASC86_07935 [Rhizobium sp. Root1212]KRD30808.1 hypothetical protein ASE37_07930 [Rhizobium sp. Root268]